MSQQKLEDRLWYKAAKALAEVHPALNVWRLSRDAFYEVAKLTGLGYIKSDENFDSVAEFIKVYRKNHEV